MSELVKKSRNVRKIRVDGEIAYVPLTQGFESVIDSSDIHLIEGFNWYAMRQKQTVYAFRNEIIDGKASLVSIHRTIAGHPHGMQVDHRDGNGLNNRKSNLRIATHQQNNLNRRFSEKNSSGLKGVSWCKERNKWLSQIQIAGKSFNLGRFDTKEDAYNAYCAYSKKLHGEFGRVK
jgi:hypothetical protein